MSCGSEQRVYYVDPDTFADLKDFVQQALTCDWTSALAASGASSFLSVSAAMRSSSGAKGLVPSPRLPPRRYRRRSSRLSSGYSRCFAVSGCGILQDGSQNRADALVEIAEAPPDRLVERNRRRLSPRAAGIFVEIAARLCATVDRPSIKDREVLFEDIGGCVRPHRRGQCSHAEDNYRHAYSRHLVLRF